MSLFLDAVHWMAWKTAFWSALVVSAVLAGPILRLLVRMKARQTVSQHAPETHQVKQGTPTMGGFILLVGAAAAFVALFVGVRSQASAAEVGVWTTQMTAAAVTLFGMGLIGFVDDGVIPRVMPGKRGLGWMPKLAMQFVVAGGAAAMLYGGDPIRLGLTAFLILFFTNAYNFADGLDALAGSMLLALVPGFLVLSMIEGSGLATSPVLAVLVGLVGAAIPFLFLNAPPARVFMGDVGSLAVGGVIGLAMATMLWPTGIGSASGSVFSPAMLPLVVLSIPLICELVPVPIQIFSVKVFKRRVFPYTPIHHAFEKAGWPETRVVWMFALFQLVCTLAAVSLVQ